ncbi:MAG: tetratricopeptide repeat protein [Paracoccaceae bacterium]|jgi:TolB-like protein/tetratricopeptide (TPR) repeat protein|nr:tetratricopeptide repeat protein [Paracoccaceae bacterium]
MSFFEELKRRNVFKVGFAYLVIAWLVAQVLELVLGTFGTPEWVMQAALVLLAAGFILSLLLAWIYELTSEGIKKESEIKESAATTAIASHGMYYVIIGVLTVVATYLFFTREQSSSHRPPDISALIARPSVIVLPFANISGDATRDYLAFGLTDELIAGLQRLGTFPVVSRNASLSFGETEVSATDFAQSHGASYLLEGSVNVSSDEIRILVNLSSADGNQVWAERYQLENGQVDIFDVSDELVSRVATAVLDSEVKRVHRTDRPPSDAWEHYIRGLTVVLAYDHKDYETARIHLEKAIEIAPEMAEAWWALGELEVLNYLTKPLLAGARLDDLNELIGYFRKAHDLSPFHAAACGCLGFMLTAVGQPDEARVVFEQALEAKPLSPDLRLDYAIYLVWAKRYDEALENAALVLKLGPSSGDRAGVWLVRSLVSFAEGEEQEALDAVHRALFVHNDPFYTPAAVALLYVSGRHDEAASLLHEMQSLFPDLEPKNPISYVMLKPIDDVLAAKRAQGITNLPLDVTEIYADLRNRIDGESD